MRKLKKQNSPRLAHYGSLLPEKYNFYVGTQKTVNIDHLLNFFFLIVLYIRYHLFIRHANLPITES
jgi:hypothetical protein